MTRKRTSAADATPVAGRHRHDGHPSGGSGDRARARAASRPARPDAALHAASEWAADRDGARALPRRHRAAATSSSRPCCSWRTTSCRCSPRCRRAATQCDAMVCAMSAAEVVKLTRLGRFDMDKPANGPMALLKRLRGGKGKAVDRRRAADEDAAPDPAAAALHPGHGAGRARLLPDAAVLARRLRREHRSTWCASWSTATPPARATRCAARSRRRRRCSTRKSASTTRACRAASPRRPRACRAVAGADAQGTVGLLLLRSYLLAGNAGHYDGVIAALEAAACAWCRPSPSGLDARPAIEQFFMQDGRADGRRGGVADRLLAGRRPGLQRRARRRRDARRSSTCPTSPRTRSSSRRVEQWGASERGLLPVESTIMVAIPELDGATSPMVFGGRAGAQARPAPAATAAARSARRTARRTCSPAPSAPRRSPARVAQLVALRRSERAAAQGRDGAVQLPAERRQHRHRRVPRGVRSRCSTRCRRCRREGYSVDVPASVDDLRSRILQGNAAQLRRRRQRAHAHRRRRSRAPRALAARRSKRSGARRPAGSRATAARSSCSARSSATCWSACSPAWATRATRCGCCSSAASRRRTRSRPSTATCARTSAPTRCCISARTARSSSCPASRPACPAPAGPTA